MKSNDIDITTGRIKLTPTGALDYDVIEARARQLRREKLSELTDDLVRRLTRLWAVMTRRRSPRPCAHGRTAAGNCADC
jgi:hypothetical protein